MLRTARGCLLPLLVVVLALGGCTRFAGPETKLSAAVADAATAVNTSRVALAQFRRGRLTAAAAGTTLADMLGQVDRAGTFAGRVPVRSREQRALRTRAVRRIGDAKAVILDARDALRRVPGAPPADAGLRGLARAAKALAALSTTLPAPR